MTKKIFALLLALVMVLAACGGDTGDDGDTTDGATTTDGDGDTGDDMDVTLRWRTRPDNQEETDLYSSVSDSLTASLDGITLEYEAGGTETAGYQQNLLTELAAGTAPDVFWIPGTDVADFATKGVILDLRDLADGSGHSDSDFYPGPMFHLTFNPDTGNTGETLWGLPRDVSTFALYINLDLIAEAGADDPRELAAAGNWNWETFQQVADDIAAIGGDIKGYGQSVWWGPYGYWLEAAGGSFFTDDRSACALDSQAAVDGLAFLAELYSGDSVVAYGEDPEAPFRAGTLGMFQNGRWATPGIRTVDFNWDVVKLPEGPGGPANWLFWGAYVVNADTEHPEEAWELVQALTSADVQAQISELGANVPSRQGQDALDAFLGFSPPDNNQAFLDGLAEDPATEGPLWAGSWPDFVPIMDAATTAVITGERDIVDYAANICSETAGAFSG